MMPDRQPHIRTLFQSDLLRVFDYRCPGHDDDGEIPQGHEIVLPRAGAYLRRDVHGTFLADPNQVLFYNQGEPYDIRHPVQGGDSSTVFILKHSLLIEMVRQYNPAVENDAGRIFQRSHLPLAARLQTIQYQLLTAPHQSMEPLKIEEQIISAIAEIIHELYRGQAMKRIQKTTRREHIHAVKLFLNRHAHVRLQLDQISSAVHLSPFHLCRIFKQSEGMTLHQYVQRLRLFNAAEQMLEVPHGRLDLFALEHGFSNHGHFATAFRQTFGLSPSEFRQRSRILKA